MPNPNMMNPQAEDPMAGGEQPGGDQQGKAIADALQTVFSFVQGLKNPEIVEMFKSFLMALQSAGQKGPEQPAAPMSEPGERTRQIPSNAKQGATPVI